MILQSLKLINYKNFESESFDFDPRINCFVGNNGIGKTNVLDAIYHLSFGKSYFNPITSQNIKHGEDFFVLEGLYSKDDKDEKIVISAKKGQKKIIKRNGKAYERFSEHIGFLPVVIISPADRDLIIEGSETRRKFIDGVISQGDVQYLRDLISYNKVLSQRNSLLKYFAANKTHNQDTLDIYNEQLDNYGTEIYKKRLEFLEEFTPIFLKRYQSISGRMETVDLMYKSQLAEADLKSLLEDNINKDKFTQYTNYGIHKDDLLFQIEGHPVKKFGSQGQQKSYLIALKLAQFDFVKAHSGQLPILLLDDIFDKLDEQRVGQIIRLVDEENFGQLFISDTHPERTEEVVKEVHQSYKMFRL
ncbi:MAG: DNA replication/repair protein RecF [Bacteroidia bacterium]|nr:DNA replication/repair protein RecF [Bacteroidia bacterium]NNF30141.1 DNA replication/repair protein RecF [Flavobacteriaceae bacterium]MBT8275019.1 DNA replication/repair protein RecF [Bacteroidia bacterium]NNJ81799.1 DNA replication/repair protein RecF [Flavobacteriaceae bacterium]NNK55495.1 DNA replication/repair protein RecF [Flavobacteriaceae bacterium]